MFRFTRSKGVSVSGNADLSLTLRKFSLFIHPRHTKNPCRVSGLSKREKSFSSGVTIVIAPWRKGTEKMRVPVPF